MAQAKTKTSTHRNLKSAPKSKRAAKASAKPRNDGAVPAMPEPDPIYAAIEEHKMTHAAHLDYLKTHDTWEKESTGEAAHFALWKYLRTKPTTMAGVIASLDYANTCADAGVDLTDGLFDPDKVDEGPEGSSPRQALSLTIATALRSIMGVQS